LGRNTVNALFVQYGYAVSAAKKNAPASMVNDVNKMNTKWLATQEADSGSAVDAVAELKWDNTIELDPIFPDEKTFRGLKEPVGA
jgi:hypothetical protein